ncbi:MAG TPA: TetR/AcrR family transcriptional regulator [Smithellaceae bacterium]|nr:TetR/AcrR family transcriptional regulator [Smithellaceae bacterium]HRS88127.1 TetR/AcrR family transcriptional regulator [Smithellaceae bacterium]HRV25399.1 TetR/AcrR family transcriptional regulator [Smithellaceae bacterium]
MPKIVDREKKRSEIAQKAIEVLAKRGFRATTIQDIADAARLGKGTIYHYFKTKEEILWAVSEQMFRETERALGAALLKINEPMDKLVALIEEALRITEEMEHLFIIYSELWLITVRGEPTGDFVHILKRLQNDMKNLVAGLINEGKKQGFWPQDIDVEALAGYLASSFDGVFAHYMIDKENFDIKRVTKEFIKFMLRQSAPKND